MLINNRLILTLLGAAIAIGCTFTITKLADLKGRFVASKIETKNTAALSNQIPFFENSAIDVGRVIVGVSKIVNFTFANNGDRPIKILKVSQSCSCSGDISFPIEAVLPGEEGEITVHYFPKAGRQRALFVAKLGNGQKHPFAILSTGYLDTFLSTNELRFPLISKDIGFERTLILMGDSKVFSSNSVSVGSLEATWLTVDVLEPECTEALQEVERPELPLRSGNSSATPLATLRVVVHPKAPVGKFSRTIMLSVRDPNGATRELSFKCIGEVREELSTMPAPLVVLATSQNYKGQVIVRSLNQPFRLTQVTSDVLECGFEESDQPTFKAFISLSTNANA